MTNLHNESKTIHKRKKWTLEEVRNYFNDEGYVLLSEVYTTSKNKLDLICPKGHYCEIRFNDFKDSSVRCKHCKADKLRLNPDYVRCFIESTGYTMVSENYIDCKSEIMVKCDRNHSYPTTFNRFHSGGRCKQCSYENKITPINIVKEVVESRGFHLLSDKFLGDDFDILVVCPNGHEVPVDFQNFKNGSGCMICYRDSQKGDGSRLWKGGLTPEKK